MNATTAAMLADAGPRYPAQQKGFGPWIEHVGVMGPSGLNRDTIVVTLTQGERRRGDFHFVSRKASAFAWLNTVAYCVKLDTAAPATGWTDPDEPDHPGDDVFSDDIEKANAVADGHQHQRMVQADDRPPSEREKAYAAGQEAPPPPPRVKPPMGLLIVAPACCKAWGL